jgi:hypothetical protein
MALEGYVGPAGKDGLGFEIGMPVEVCFEPIGRMSQLLLTGIVVGPIDPSGERVNVMPDEAFPPGDRYASLHPLLFGRKVEIEGTTVGQWIINLLDQPSSPEV